MPSTHSLNNQLQKLIGKRDTLQATRKDLSDRLKAASAESELNEEARLVIQTVSEATQHEAYASVEGLVTHALRYIFEEDYTFRIVTKQQRGKVEATALVEKDGVLLDPLRECGGGVVDVVCFALRVVSITSSSTTASRRILILDEPFRFLSASYRPRAAQLLKDLANELSFQLLIVTHDSDFQIGEVVNV